MYILIYIDSIHFAYINIYNIHFVHINIYIFNYPSKKLMKSNSETNKNEYLVAGNQIQTRFPYPRFGGNFYPQIVGGTCASRHHGDLFRAPLKLPYNITDQGGFGGWWGRLPPPPPLMPRYQPLGLPVTKVPVWAPIKLI